nr:immunoglobulin heavy chain junction region [Mus musculus]
LLCERWGVGLVLRC